MAQPRVIEYDYRTDTFIFDGVPAYADDLAPAIPEPRTVAAAPPWEITRWAPPAQLDEPTTSCAGRDWSMRIWRACQVALVVIPFCIVWLVATAVADVAAMLAHFAVMVAMVLVAVPAVWLAGRFTVHLGRPSSLPPAQHLLPAFTWGTPAASGAPTSRPAGRTPTSASRQEATAATEAFATPGWRRVLLGEAPFARDEVQMAPTVAERWLVRMRDPQTPQAIGTWRGGHYDLLADALYGGDIATAVNSHSEDKCAVSWLLHEHNPNGWNDSSKRGRPSHDDWENIKGIYGSSWLRGVARMNDGGMPLSKIADVVEPELRSKGFIR
jgi:hypothetical protein